MRISVLLADDHTVVRQGLRALLEHETDLDLVGEAADGLEVLRLVEKLKPAVLVLDLMMPGLNGLEVCERVCRLEQGTRVVVLSMHSEEAYVHAALRAGALGYVVKGATSQELIRAIREAAHNRRFLSSAISEKGLAAYASRAMSAPADTYDTLTAREREVLQLAAEGYSSSEIAQRLFISPRTVETHRSNLLQKLGLKGQTELVRYAIRRGIVSVEAK
jgi:DNA-binding NarL/FixJ family response regulator